MHATWTICLLVPLLADPLSPALTGTVLDQNDQPLARARVDITTAAPRVGKGIFCPSCYRDCVKSTRTDEQGRFEIKDLDPTLKFRVLVSASGMLAKQTDLIDPLEDEVRIKLTVAPTDLPPKRTFRGQAVNDAGQPIEGALIDISSAVHIVDERYTLVDVGTTVTDPNGDFEVLLPENSVQVTAEFFVDSYAGARFTELRPSVERQRLVIPAGTSVTGRLLRDGTAAQGVRVAVVQLNRSSDHHFIKAIGAVTDRDGRYKFEYLPADESYAIFTVVGDAPQEYVLVTETFKALKDRHTLELLDMQLVPALRISGKVNTVDGSRLPPNARILVDRDPAWDSIAVPVTNDGTFSINGLSSEDYRLLIRVEGFELDKSSINYKIIDNFTFVFPLAESLSDLNFAIIKSPKRAVKTD